MKKAVLFDVDGTLLESRDFLYKAINRALAEIGQPRVGKEIFEIAKQREIGTIEYYTREVLGKPELKPKMYASFLVHYCDLLENEIELVPGVRDVWDKLKQNGIKIGLLTTQHRIMLDIVLKRFSLEPDASVTSDEVPNKKPAPDQVHWLCEKFKVEPKDAVVVGDWSGDIRAGKSAGAETVGVLTGVCTREELEREGADHIIEDVSGLLPLIGFPGAAG